MADFIIKSAAGTGNKTLIQGQDQSGSNYAIEIGDAGALKLGTISAGTVSTGVTFPAGHIIQCRGDRYNAKDDGGTIDVTQSTSTPFGTNLEVEITCSSTSNFLRVDVHIPDCYTGTNSGGFHLGVVQSTDNYSSYGGLPGTTGSDSNGQYIVSPYNLYHSNGTDIFPVNSMVYCSVPTTSTMKIRPFLKSQQSETYELLSNHAAFSGHASVTVMEIQG